MGCGSVAMVTYLLLRRLLPSSVATFKAPTLQYPIRSEFNCIEDYKNRGESGDIISRGRCSHPIASALDYRSSSPGLCHIAWDEVILLCS